MELKKFLCALLACVVVASCLFPPARAAEDSDEKMVWLDDLRWEQIDLSTVEHMEDGVMPRAKVPADGIYSAYSIYALGQPISLQANDFVTFNCSYSPSSASMDFGVIAPNGRFYYVNVKEGSINQAIRISQAGSYSVAIRNNSSQAVRVVGFVNY